MIMAFTPFARGREYASREVFLYHAFLCAEHKIVRIDEFRIIQLADAYICFDGITALDAEKILNSTSLLVFAPSGMLYTLSQ